MTKPVGPYTPALRVGPWLVCSGQIGIEAGPDGPVLVEGLEAQTRRALANVTDLLAGHELTWANVVKTTAFLTDMNAYGIFNQLYVEHLGSSRPARSVVAVSALPLGALVEIEVWAYSEA